jgi:predicted acetyltransferase
LQTTDSEIKIEAIPKAEKPIAWAMEVDFSTEWNRDWFGIFTERAEYEKAGVRDYFDKFWAQADFLPFFFKVKGTIIGFSVVKKEAEFHEIIEFYIKPEFRAGAIALSFAIALAEKFGGPWRVSTLKANLRAVRFWQKLFELRTKIKTHENEKRIFWEFI